MKTDIDINDPINTAHLRACEMILQRHSALVSGPCLLIIGRFFQSLRILHSDARQVAVTSPDEDSDPDTVVLAHVTVDGVASYYIAVNRATFLRIAAAA
jgi:hypothetical protein